MLIDTFLLRSLLVRSLVVLLGRWNWWPSHLARTPLAEDAGPGDQPAGRLIARIPGRPDGLAPYWH